MRIGMQKAREEGGLELKQWSVAFRGPTIDDRGTAAVKCVSARSSAVMSISYRPESVSVEVNGAEADADSLPNLLASVVHGRPVLEATTMGFVEILLCCRAFRRLGISAFDITYVEPHAYRSRRKLQLLHRRDFELSDSVPGYRAIPGFAILLDDRTPQRGVFFLGYEEARLTAHSRICK